MSKLLVAEVMESSIAQASSEEELVSVLLEPRALAPAEEIAALDLIEKSQKRMLSWSQTTGLLSACVRSNS